MQFHLLRMAPHILKEIFVRCDVTRLLSVVVMLLAFEPFNLDSVHIKIKPFYFYTKVKHFFTINFGIFCLEIFTKFLKLGLKYLINRRFF